MVSASFGGVAGHGERAPGTVAHLSATWRLGDSNARADPSATWCMGHGKLVNRSMDFIKFNNIFFSETIFLTI
jgi:hypothetical protein